MPRRVALLTAIVLAATSAAPARGEDALPADEPSSRSPIAAGALFGAGAASAFLAHEGGHLAANLALGNAPHLAPVSFAGAIPFFTVDPRISCIGDRCTAHGGATFGPGRRGLFTILSAGLDVQHLTDEIVLTRDPGLRLEDAPFRKGLLAFNTLTSVAYVAADVLGVEPSEGDLSAMYRDTRAPRTVVNALVLGIAAVDVARYFFPGARWLPWVSRVAKVSLGGVAFTL